MGIGEWDDGGEGIDSGCGQVPSGGRRGIGRRGSCCGNGQGDDRNDRLGDSEDGCVEGELVHCLPSTTIRVVEELVLPQTQWGKRRRRSSGRMWSEWTRR